LYTTNHQLLGRGDPLASVVKENSEDSRLDVVAALNTQTALSDWGTTDATARRDAFLHHALRQL
jgi:hypothetical protein